MRFGPNDEQRMLQKAARDYFSRGLGEERLRRHLEDPAFPDALWRGVAALGWPGALVAEDHGGAGLALQDLFGVLEEAGRAAAPLPLLETAVVGAQALRSATPVRAAEWLPALARGELVVATALYEEADVVEPAACGVRARAEGDAWILDGIKPIVPFGADAHLVITLARTAPGDAGLRLFAVPRATGGLRATAVPLADLTARAARLEFDGVRVPADHLLGARERPADLAPLVRAARVALCADMLGGCQRLVEMSVEYAKQRVQFGQAIGSFQAIKHKLAEMHLALEGIRGLAFAAAAAADTPTADPIVELAKASCNDAYRMIASEAMQVHGGIGFTWEHDIHIFYKRALRFRSTLGTSRQLFYEVGQSVLAGHSADVR